jgi:hypothetical protein
MLAVMHFFKPSLLILMIFGMFMIIAVISQLQAWGTNAQMAGKPKPPFHDQLRPYLFISIIYVFSVLPLFYLALYSTTILPGEMVVEMIEPFSPVWILAHVTYFYLASCVAAYIIRHIKWDNESWRRAQGITS